jgi:pullulanase/glycogen debranching enzyme
MVVGGDELLRAQNGDNNVRCRDNTVTWLAWTLAARNTGLPRPVRLCLKNALSAFSYRLSAGAPPSERVELTVWLIAER